MTVDEVFDAVKRVPDNDRWAVSDAAMEEYSGGDKELVRQSLDEFILSNSQINGE